MVYRGKWITESVSQGTKTVNLSTNTAEASEYKLMLNWMTFSFFPKTIIHILIWPFQTQPLRLGSAVVFSSGFWYSGTNQIGFLFSLTFTPHFQSTFNPLSLVFSLNSFIQQSVNKLPWFAIQMVSYNIYNS